MKAVIRWNYLLIVVAGGGGVLAIILHEAADASLTCFLIPLGTSMATYARRARLTAHSFLIRRRAFAAVVCQAEPIIIPRGLIDQLWIKLNDDWVVRCYYSPKLGHMAGNSVVATTRLGVSVGRLTTFGRKRKLPTRKRVKGYTGLLPARERMVLLTPLLLAAPGVGLLWLCASGSLGESSLLTVVTGPWVLWWQAWCGHIASR